MAKEFQVQNADEFEQMITSKDFRISEALVSTILKNLKSTKRHHHALSVISIDLRLLDNSSIHFCGSLNK